MSTPNPDNLYAPPVADVSTGESAKVPMSLLRRYLLVLVPCGFAALFLMPFTLEFNGDSAWGVRALAVVASWPLPVLLILLPFAREAGGWGKLPLRTRLLVGLSYPFAAILVALFFAVVLLLAVTILERVVGY